MCNAMHLAYAVPSISGLKLPPRPLQGDTLRSFLLQRCYAYSIALNGHSFEVAKIDTRCMGCLVICTRRLS
jgi:hypothetical protein